jgi:hypothetical protein
MNRGELRDAIKDRLTIRSDGFGNSLDGLISNAFVNTSINDALNRVSVEKDWWWLATTASLTFNTTTGKAPLPADFMRANELVINDSAVEYVPLETLLSSESNSYCHTIYGKEVLLSPIPSVAPSATLYYFRSEPALAADGTSPLMPPLYHYALVCYGAFLCSARRQDEQRASLYLQEYGNWLKSMSDDNRATIKRRIKHSKARDYASWE